MFDLQRDIVNENGERAHLVSINIVYAGGDSQMIDRENFNEKWDEYIDPRDLEIQRLLKELEALKLKHKPVRKKKRSLNTGERAEVRQLISRGESNTTIAQEYDISDSAVSRIRKGMVKEGNYDG